MKRESTVTAKLLIVEDEVSILLLLSDVFKIEGYEVNTAENGQTALKQVLLKRPDLVISDVRMPVSDGFELTRNLSKLLPPVPILLVSGYAGQSDVESLKHDNTNLVGFIPKPFELDSLLETVKNFIEKTKAQPVAN